MAAGARKCVRDECYNKALSRSMYCAEHRAERLKDLKEWDDELFNFCPCCGIAIEAPSTSQQSNIDMFNKLVQRRVQ